MKIRQMYLRGVPRLDDALIEASGVRDRFTDEPADPTPADQILLAAAIADCLAAVRRAKPHRPLRVESAAGIRVIAISSAFELGDFPASLDLREDRW